jgi:SAM-dependent methyltransferase
MLDVGAGSGTITASFAELAPEAQITALDMSGEILNRAREHAQSVGVDKNMSFQQGSVYELPFDDSSFDVVHAHQLLCHLSTPVDAIKEILRVARPGGFVALRESDLEMWCMWPESRGLRRFQEVLLQLHGEGGGSTTGGRRLLSWAVAAGAKREDITAGFGTWCFSEQHDKEVWGKFMPIPIPVSPHIVSSHCLYIRMENC